LIGNGGNDVAYGNQGGDFIFGNTGSDTLFGGKDGDALFGGQDADVICRRGLYSRHLNAAYNIKYKELRQIKGNERVGWYW